MGMYDIHICCGLSVCNLSQIGWTFILDLIHPFVAGRRGNSHRRAAAAAGAESVGGGA